MKLLRKLVQAKSHAIAAANLRALRMKKKYFMRFSCHEGSPEACGFSDRCREARDLSTRGSRWEHYNVKKAALTWTSYLHEVEGVCVHPCAHKLSPHGGNGRRVEENRRY